jgi:hypothetical protein
MGQYHSQVQSLEYKKDNDQQVQELSLVKMKVIVIQGGGWKLARLLERILC